MIKNSKLLTLLEITHSAKHIQNSIQHLSLYYKNFNEDKDQLISLSQDIIDLGYKIAEKTRVK